MSVRAIGSLAALAALSWFSSALADPANIVVTGSGEVRTPPDIATATFEIRGEGATPDAATTNLVKKSDAVVGGISSIIKAKLAITTGKMNVNAVRGPGCKSDDDERPRLSTGDCAVSGYVATVNMKAQVSPPSEAGTVLSLAARLGGENANLSDFSLRDPTDAQKKALAAALVDARGKALAIAEGAGMHLGALLNVKDRTSEGEVYGDDVTEVVVTAPKLQPRPPVAVALKPEPIVTSAQLTVSYSVAP